MDLVRCPRCGVIVPESTGVRRCSSCGVHFRLQILNEASDFQIRTGIAEGMPPATGYIADEVVEPQGYLGRLLHCLRFWRRWHAVPTQDAAEPADRIGWAFFLLTMLPYLLCGPLVIVFPVAALLSFLPRFPDQREVMRLTYLCIYMTIPLSLMGLWAWLRIRRYRRQMRQAYLREQKNACYK
jgi:hypothetical protein